MVVRFICQESPLRRAVQRGLLRRRSVAAVGALLLLISSRTFPDARVISGSGPEFPLAIDSVYFFAWHDSAGAADSAVTALPQTWYADLRNNIDSVFNYVSALRSHRKELSGCGHGCAFRSCLSFYTEGEPTLKVMFGCGDYAGGKLVTATDHYPFVVKLTKGFAAKLKRLASGK